MSTLLYYALESHNRNNYTIIYIRMTIQAQCAIAWTIKIDLYGIFTLLYYAHTSHNWNNYIIICVYYVIQAQNVIAWTIKRNVFKCLYNTI